LFREDVADALSGWRAALLIPAGGLSLAGLWRRSLCLSGRLPTLWGLSTLWLAALGWLATGGLPLSALWLSALSPAWLFCSVRTVIFR